MVEDDFEESLEQLPVEPARDYRAPQRPADVARRLAWSWHRARAESPSTLGVLGMAIGAGFATSLALIALLAGQLAFGVVAGGMAALLAGSLVLTRFNHSRLELGPERLVHVAAPLPFGSFDLPRESIREIRVARAEAGSFRVQVVHDEGTADLPRADVEHTRHIGRFLASGLSLELVDPVAAAAAAPRARVETSSEWRSSASQDEREHPVWGDYEVFDDDERIL